VDLILGKFFLMIFFGYCMVPFGLLKFVRWWPVYKSIYFYGTILFGLWPVYSPWVKKICFLGGKIETSQDKIAGSVGAVDERPNSNGKKVN